MCIHSLKAAFKINIFIKSKPESYLCVSEFKNKFKSNIKMRCILSTSSNPYFNLATEEYLLKSTDEEIFLIYINEPCIVVGKHQNLLSEINLLFTLENKIKLARRISGGGTVYQDLNNVNFSFIHNITNLEKLNFKKFTNPILEALREMGLDVVFSDRNDLLIDSKKISGNAMHIYKTRVLSHGTILYNANLNILSAALKNSPQKYIDKSIKSVRSKVTNIWNYLELKKSIDDFENWLFQIIISNMANPITKQITKQEMVSIDLICKSKYETWDWIYAYSPKYVFRNEINLPNKSITFEIHVEKGVIKNVITNINSAQNAEYQYIFNTLPDLKHEYKSILEYIKKDPEINSNQSINLPVFCRYLF